MAGCRSKATTKSMSCTARTTPPIHAQDAALRCFADWTAKQLGNDVYGMADWPDHLTLNAPDTDNWLHVTHGTLAGNRNGISQSIPDRDLEGKIPDDIDLFITAHTHKALKRRFGDQRILNVGSVGSPFDGDVRASYGRIEFKNDHWHGDIIRLNYDRERMKKDCIDSGFLDEAGPLAQLIYREWEMASLLMPYWNLTYRQAVMDGEVTMERAMSAVLKHLSL